MAISPRSWYLQGQNKTASTTLSTTVTGTGYPQVGDWILCVVSYDNASATTPGISGITATNVSGGWSLTETATGATASGSAKVSLAIGQVTTAFTAGTLPQITFTGSVAAKAALFVAFSGVGGTPVVSFAPAWGATATWTPSGESSGDISVLLGGSETDTPPTISAGTQVGTGVATTGGGAASNVAVIAAYNATINSAITFSAITDGAIYGVKLPGATTTPVSQTKATTWNTLQRVTATRATTWNVNETLTQVSSTRATTWAVLTKTTQTKATTWNALATTTATRATTWNAFARTTQALATTWSVLTKATNVTPTTWSVLSSVTPATRATTWATLATVTQTKATTWNVAGAGVTSVTATRATTWNVAATITQTKTTSWIVRSLISNSKATTWKVAAIVTGTKGTTWNTFAIVTQTKSTTWNVASPVTQVSATRSTTWAVFAIVTQTKATTWNTCFRIIAFRATTWNVAGSGGALDAFQVYAWDGTQWVLQLNSRRDVTGVWVP